MGGGCHSNGQDMKFIIVDKARAGGIHKKRCRCGERLQELIRPFPMNLLDFREEITDLYTMVQICSNPESGTKLPPQRENRPGFPCNSQCLNFCRKDLGNWCITVKFYRKKIVPIWKSQLYRVCGVISLRTKLLKLENYDPTIIKDWSTESVSHRWSSE